MKWYVYIVISLSLQHCASVSYFEKHQIKGPVKSLTSKTFETKFGKSILKEKSEYTFTKNGRIKFSQTFDAENNLIKTVEKKLWFTKRSYPDKEPYYCKTRWKLKNRERISCYTQKQYKKNGLIYYYHKKCTQKKVVDKFTTYETEY